MKTSKELFGKTAGGEEIWRYRLENEAGVVATFLNLGAIWEKMLVPGKDGEVADVILYLASDRASYVTGQILRVDAGIG